VRVLLGEDRRLTLFEKFWVTVTARVRAQITTAFGASAFLKDALVEGYSKLRTLMLSTCQRLQVRACMQLCVWASCCVRCAFCGLLVCAVRLPACVVAVCCCACSVSFPRESRSSLAPRRARLCFPVSAPRPCTLSRLALSCARTCVTSFPVACVCVLPASVRAQRNTDSRAAGTSGVGGSRFEQERILWCVSGLHDTYINRSLARLNEPLQMMFPRQGSRCGPLLPAPLWIVWPRPLPFRVTVGGAWFLAR
jgi:hypothetical protein